MFPGSHPHSLIRMLLDCMGHDESEPRKSRRLLKSEDSCYRRRSVMSVPSMTSGTSVTVATDVSQKRYCKCALESQINTACNNVI